MKMLSSTKGILFFLVFSLSASEVPYILEVQKDTPLYSRPSLKSSRLAEAEAGTLLLYVEKSKKNIWVKLQDSEGMTGWMPLERTDYKEVERAREQLEEIESISHLEKQSPLKKQKTRDEMIEEAQAERVAEPFRPFLRLAPLMRWLSDEEPAASRVGLRIDYNLGKTSLNGNGALNPAWASVEASFPSPFISHSNDISAAFRYVWRAPLWGPFVYGPDLGYSVDKVRSDYRHHFSAGLSSGIAMGPFDLMLRGGYDFFARSRAVLELQLGVSF